MRKTTSKQIKLSDTVNQPTIIKAKRVVKPNVSLQSQIDKAVEQMKSDDKEAELLKRELEKPMKMRNKALMEKHGYLDSSQLTDNYPNLNKGIFYEIEMYFPEDDGVELSKRPKPWYVGLSIDYAGHRYTYRFPIHAGTFHDGQHMYKLDGFPVYVDTAAIIRNDISEYTIFQALTDYTNKNDRDGLVNEVFYKYKIIDETALNNLQSHAKKKIWDDSIQKQFAIKGQRLFVASKVLENKNKTPAKIVHDIKTDDSPHGVTQEYTVPDVFIDSNTDIKHKDELRSRPANQIIIDGLSQQIPKDILTLKQFYSIAKPNTDTPRYYILSYNESNPNMIELTISVGPAKALEFAKSIIPGNGITRQNLNVKIAQNNKAVYEKYIDTITNKPARDLEEKARQKIVDDQNKEERLEVSKRGTLERLRVKSEKTQMETRAEAKKKLIEEMQKLLASVAINAKTDRTSKIREVYVEKEIRQELTPDELTSVKQKMNALKNAITKAVKLSGVKQLNQTSPGIYPIITRLYVSKNDEPTYADYLTEFSFNHELNRYELKLFAGMTSLRNYLGDFKNDDKTVLTSLIENNQKVQQLMPSP